MAAVNGGGLTLGGLWMRRSYQWPSSTTASTSRCALKIMAALDALPAEVGLEFVRLKKLTGATDGNLGAHIETLAKAGYVSVEKAFVGKKPQTTVTATAAGRGAFARHVATLQEIVAGKQG
ncbi:DNA-binding MarR family transcriptional regulator [Bradyrhizobium yuanmingense]|uniref:DNA-binding MarR family transcriptional regulator n=1 Tax=Bradyrhizobium yuanmingense TaxID=108015 RepID=A0ABV4GG75_9BRAD